MKPHRNSKDVEIVAAQFEDDCVECLVKVPKSSPLIGMIERKEIVSVSIEGEWSHGIPGFGLVLIGLAWLTKNTTLPGIPLTRIIPVERIVESFEVKQRVLEQLRVNLFSMDDGKVRLKAKELLDPLTCVFCGAPGEYLVSTCCSCGDKAATQTNGSEKLELEEKDVEKIAEKVSVKVSEKSSVELEKVKNELAEAQKKITDSEGKTKVAEAARDEANGKAVTAESKCAAAVKVAEDLKKLVPGVDLLANPPLLMPISEHIAVLESLVPPAVVERSSMGMQRQCQAVRAAILKGKEKLGGK